MPDRPTWIKSLAARANRLLDMPNDDPRKIVGVAVVLCLVCSIAVSANMASLSSETT